MKTIFLTHPSQISTKSHFLSVCPHPLHIGGYNVLGSGTNKDFPPEVLLSVDDVFRPFAGRNPVAADRDVVPFLPRLETADTDLFFANLMEDGGEFAGGGSGTSFLTRMLYLICKMRVMEQTRCVWTTDGKEEGQAKCTIFYISKLKCPRQSF